MPYITMRRTDIPNGILQVWDLWPNDSQRNYTLDPPGQSGYVRQIPLNQTVATTGAGPILTVRDYCGLAAYLIDNVEDSSTTALTAAVANAASLLIIGRVRGGLPLLLADVDAALIAAGATAGTGLTAGNSTGVLAEVLALLAGAKYMLPAGSEIEDAGNLFVPGPHGAFEEPPHTRLVLQTGAFNVSNGAGLLFGYKQPVFEYNGVLGPAVTIFADNGALL